MKLPIILFLVVVPITLVLFLTKVFAADYKLSCSDARQSVGIEAALLKQSSGLASRLSEHVLEIKTNAGVKRFTDKPPYEELSGIRWIYGGYDKQNELHLICKNDEELFTGILLFEKAGKILKAGYKALISPDKHQYLAIEQTDGKEGEDWTIFNLKGERIWTGSDGLTSEHGEFENPSWDQDLNLTVDVSCDDGRTTKETITLKKTGANLKWVPTPTACPGVK